MPPGQERTVNAGASTQLTLVPRHQSAGFPVLTLSSLKLRNMFTAKTFFKFTKNSFY